MIKFVACVLQLLAKIVTKFNLETPNFKKFPGGGGMPPDPPRNRHALHAIFVAHFILKKSTFSEKEPPTKNPGYGPVHQYQTLHM